MNNPNKLNNLTILNKDSINENKRIHKKVKFDLNSYDSNSNSDNSYDNKSNIETMKRKTSILESCLKNKYKSNNESSQFKGSILRVKKTDANMILKMNKNNLNRSQQSWVVEVSKYKFFEHNTKRLIIKLIEKIDLEKWFKN